MAQEHLFLTTSQALTAICLDFRSYGPQTMLFCQVLRTLGGAELNFQREPGKAGLWVSDPEHGRMRWLEGDELVAYMCRKVRAANLDVETLAVLCRMVFQAPCRTTRYPETRQMAIVVQTDMTAFNCRQCGQCCRRLNYCDGITRTDVERLKRANRTDVLQWVRPVRTRQGDLAYRIWVVPGNNQFATTCPFLTRGVTPHHWVCAIHDVKPDVCRHYPVSRKHARMTGCPGFDISAPGRSSPMNRTY